jgi:VIT1/CCC1 family predicted Fe2+/Mn2+ transporter
MTPEEAQAHATQVLAGLSSSGLGATQSVPTVPVGAAPGVTAADPEPPDTVGSALGAAVSSFLFFASGAVVPVIPYLFGLQGLTAVLVSAVLVGIALLGTGAIVGLLSGASPLKRALRQLAIGYGAATATYLLGLLFGVSAA